MLLLLCVIPGYHLGTHFSHPQFSSQCQTNGFPAHVHFISSRFDCSSSFGSNKFSYPCCVVTCACCWWSSAAPFISNKGSAFRNHFVPAWCSWHYIISNGLLKFPTCCGILTDFNAQKDDIPLREVSCFPLHDKVHKHVPTGQASTPHCSTAQPLQVGIKEGPRSKVVCVSRLQYCQ